MKISINQLKHALTVIAKHLEDLDQQEFILEEDFYWIIGTGELYDPTTLPVNPTLGQLSFDWEEIEGIASGKKEPVGYALVWLSSLIRAIGEKTVG